MFLPCLAATVVEPFLIHVLDRLPVKCYSGKVNSLNLLKCHSGKCASFDLT